MLPDLQSAVLCEDVRCEVNGMQTLVGVLSVIPAPGLPITCMRLCIWARWCGGTGKFRQKSRIVGVDEIDLDRHYISWLSPLARAFVRPSSTRD